MSKISTSASITRSGNAINSDMTIQAFSEMRSEAKRPRCDTKVQPQNVSALRRRNSRQNGPIPDFLESRPPRSSNCLIADNTDHTKLLNDYRTPQMNYSSLLFKPHQSTVSVVLISQLEITSYLRRSSAGL